MSTALQNETPKFVACISTLRRQREEIKQLKAQNDALKRAVELLWGRR